MSTIRPAPPPPRPGPLPGGLWHGVRAALHRLLGWVAPRIGGFHSVLGLFLASGLALALAATWGFAELAEAVAGGQTQRLDVAILRWMEQHHSRALDVAALEVTALGSTTVVAMLLLITSAFLWVSRHRYSLLLLWVAVGGGALLNLVLKAAYHRPRPQLFEWRVEYAGQSSFPSGHAMASAIAYLTLAYLIARLASSARLQRLTWLLAALVVLLIGASRVYLGVHYPSDVLAGFVVGFAWASFCATGIEVVRYFRARRPQVAAQEEDL